MNTNLKMITVLITAAYNSSKHIYESYLLHNLAMLTSAESLQPRELNCCTFIINPVSLMNLVA